MTAPPEPTSPRRATFVPAMLMRRHPVTVGLLLLLALTATLAPANVPRIVATGVGRPLWTLLTSALWCSGAMAYLATGTAVVVLVGAAERRLGSRITAAALVLGHVLGTAVGLSAIWALRQAGDIWARQVSTMAVLGPLPGVLAAAGMASASASTLWRRRLRLSTSILLVALVLYSGTAGDVVRLAAWLLGLLAGRLVRAADEAADSWHPSRREGRALVALVVAVTALGPLLAAISRTPEGPWAVVSHLFVSARPHHQLLRAVCGRGGDPEFCRVLQARARLTGHGPTLLSILPVVLQLVLAEGLRRGRHAAWLAAVIFSAALTVVGGAIVVTVLRTPADELPLLAARPGTLPAVSVAAPLVAPLAVLVLLLLTRTRFGVRAAPGAVRRWWISAGLGLAALAAGYVVIGSMLSRDWAGAPSPLTLLADLPRRLLPPGYLGEVPLPLAPRDGRTRVLADWTGVAAWTVLLVTAVRLIRPMAPAGDAAAARALVDQYGETALSYMTTWTGNHYWFLPDRSAVVAYRVLGGVALTTGDPVGPHETRAAAVRGFTTWCEEQGWTPCWYSVTDETAQVLADTGAQQLQVAAEMWLPLPGLSFRGRRWQDVRTAVNRAAREGLQARWFTWSQAPVTLREQVARLSEQWLADKSLPEMGFTLGGLDELADDAVRCLIAVTPDGEVTALTSWLPAHRDGVLVGWTLDVMRRARTARPGVVEFLIATAATTFQKEGAEWMSLSGAPLALPPGTADANRLTRLLELAGRTLEPVYGFRSLLSFKTKFQPSYRPLWLVYLSPTDLPRIARAISTAYLPHVSARQAARLARTLLRRNRSRHQPEDSAASVPAAASGR